jgi:hypothetical protein
VIDETIAARLAYPYSRIWSYQSRLEHLLKAVEVGKTDIGVKIAKEIKEPEDPKIEAKMQAWFTRSVQDQLEATATAGITVLIQSMFDGVLNDLLAVCVENNLGDWPERIYRSSRKQYSLAEALALDHRLATERATVSFLRALGHKPIAERHILLVGSVGYKFGAKESTLILKVIQRADRARHQIVHENGLISGDYKTAWPDAGLLLDHARTLVLATATRLGVSKDDLASQMSKLGLEGVATPWTPDLADETEGPTAPQ